MLHRFLFSPAGGTSVVNDVGLLVLRVLTGLGLALGHGRGKLPPSERFVQRVAEMGFPLADTFAWAAGLAEFGGGLLLVAGLLTRPAATASLMVLGSAFFLAHGASFGEGEKAYVYAAAMLTLALAGAGRFSLDAGIARRRTGYVDRFRRR